MDTKSFLTLCGVQISTVNKKVTNLQIFELVLIDNIVNIFVFCKNMHTANKNMKNDVTKDEIKTVYNYGVDISNCPDAECIGRIQ